MPRPPKTLDESAMIEAVMEHCHTLERVELFRERDGDRTRVAAFRVGSAGATEVVEALHRNLRRGEPYALVCTRLARDLPAIIRRFTASYGVPRGA